MKTIFLAALMASSVIFLSRPCLAQAVQYTSALTASEEVPPNDGKGTGSVAANFDPQMKMLKWHIEYSGLTGDVTAAHFHGPAGPGKNAPPVIPLSGSLKSPIDGTAKLTDEQAKALADGLIYFNLHTNAHKDGEVRGQMKQTM